MIKRALSAAVSAALILLSPGLAPYQALAAGTQSPGGRAPGRGPAALPVQRILIKGPAVGLNLFPAGVNLALPDLNAPAPAPGAKVMPEGAVPLAAANAATPKPSPAPAAAAKDVLPARFAPRSFQAASASSASVLDDAGDLLRAEPGRAHQAGRDLGAALTGVRLGRYGDEGFVPAGGDFFGAFSGGVHESELQVYGRAAGDESIRPAVEANYRGPAAPTTPDDGDGGDGGGNDGGEGGGESPRSRAPLIPRILASLIVASPAVLLGWPLLAGGAVAAGVVVVLASVGVASYPFMSPRTAKLTRSLPAVAIVSSGALILAGLAAAFSWPAAVMGGAAVLGGWGLFRFARDQKKWERAEDIELMLTAAGASAAVVGAGLILLSPAGWTAFLVYPAMVGAAFLMMHLPGWVGAGIANAARAAKLAVEDAFRAAYSHWSDTPLGKRLVNWTEAAVEASAWSAFPIGLLVWVPVLGVELVRLAFALPVALFSAALRLPVALLWGAAHELSPKSWPARFLAEWARAHAAASKTTVLNRLEKPLIPLTESQNGLVRLIGGGLVAGAQLVHGIAAAAWAVLGLPVGFVLGLARAGRAYDAKRHDPSEWELAADPLDGAYEDPAEPVVAGGAWLSRLASAALALIPVYYLGLPLFAYRPYSGGLYLAAAALIALLPLHPRGAWFPGFLRRLPALALTLSGLLALVTGTSLAYGALALLGGLGLSRLIDSIAEKESESGKASRWKVTGGRYILGFAAAVAVAAALGADLSGLVFWAEEAGWANLDWGNAAAGAGLALSPALLYHLGKPFWTGIWTGIKGYFHDLRAAAHVFFAWADDKKLAFGDNLGGWFKHWHEKSGWNWWWLWVPGAAVLAAGAVYGALTLATGIFLGTLHFIPNALWGAAYAGNPNSRWTRFWSGVARSLTTTQSGSDAWYKRLVLPLKPWLDARIETPGSAPRPALKAFAALVPFVLAQALWLSAVALATTVWVGVGVYLGLPLHFAALLGIPAAYYLVKAVVDGVRNAWGAKAKPEDGRDADRPRNFLKD